MKPLGGWRTYVSLGTIFLAFAAAALASDEHSWSYSGATGPEHWSEVSATCALGTTQSPIDILHAEKKHLPDIEFAYQSSPLKVINTGHTIQVNYAPGSTITLDGKTYELTQFHFHHLSETTISGQHSPMELHLVHKDKDGNLAVVAILVNEGPPNQTVSTVWRNLPAMEGKEVAPEHVEIDAVHMVPANHSYYTFPGSLTTPPCTEGVKWLVLATPLTLSKDQIAKFAAIYPTNARPVQPLNGRVVLQSE